MSGPQNWNTPRWGQQPPPPGGGSGWSGGGNQTPQQGGNAGGGGWNNNNGQQWGNQQPQQQQQQWGGGGNQQNQQWGGGQQQQQWGGGNQQQWGQQPGVCDQCCGQCCNQQQGGMCGQCCGQQGGCCTQCCQPGMCTQFCPQPQGPVDPFCWGPDQPDQQQPTFLCDLTGWIIGLFALLTLVGFAVVLGANKIDNLYDAFSATDSSDLEEKLTPLIPYRYAVSKNCSVVIAQLIARYATTPAPVVPTTTTSAPTTLFNTTTTTSAVTTTTTVAPATPEPTLAPINYSYTPQCTRKNVFGTFGTVCMEDDLSVGAFVVNLQNWNNSRGTLYFLAFIITWAVLVVFFMVASHRNQPPPQQGDAHNASMNVGPGFCASQPQFYGSPLYEVLRVVWFVAAFVFFFWVANTMTSFFSVISFYKSHTTGDLKAFWEDYESKFIASMVCVWLYLCWPILLLALEMVLWLGCGVPYFCIRCVMKPGLDSYPRPDQPWSAGDLPFWLRAEMFFCDLQQARRLGFTTKLWHMVTGTHEPYCTPFECCSQLNSPQGPGWGGQQQPGQHPQDQAPWQRQQQQTPQQQLNSSQRGNQPPPPATAPSPHRHSVHAPSAPSMGSSGLFQPQLTTSTSLGDTTVIRSGQGEEEMGEVKTKKHKKDKKDKSTKDKGTKEKGTKEKKEKKHKKDKKEDRAGDSD